MFHVYTGQQIVLAYHLEIISQSAHALSQPTPPPLTAEMRQLIDLQI